MSQGRIPTTDTAVQNAADFIISGAQEVRPIYNPNTGKDEPTIVMNAKAIGWMSQTVASNKLGLLATNVEILSGMAEQGDEHMPQERASFLRRFLDGYIQSVKFGINAKSSETTRDNKNPHNNVVQMFAKQPSPYIKEDEDIQSRGMAGFFGRRESREE